MPRRYVVLGTDGFGRSDTREQLRRFFEVDRNYITVAALKALADDGTIPATKVADAISQDMAMTAKVLQMANSAFFGRRRRVSDPLQAVQLLGLNTVKALVLSAYAFGEYEKRAKTPGFSFERLQALPWARTTLEHASA